jgi:predicted aspartyl protease
LRDPYPFGRPRSAPLLRTRDLHLDLIIRRPENAPASAHAKQSLPSSGLIDTGASVSCVDKTLVERLDLVRSGQDEIMTVAGPATANIYQAIVVAPQLEFQKVMALWMPLDHPVPSMVLLGRDFLSDFMVQYDGPERTFSFYHAGQHPSDAAYDEDG